ncbi:MAG: prenyltransferase/squalene oxidase repeat-containing protein [Pseudomonadota bacterium]
MQPSTGLDATIDLAGSRLAALQRKDGSWPGDTHGGPDNTAIWFLTHRLVFGEHHPLLPKALTRLQSIQQEDGGFLPYSGADSSSLRASAIVAALLHQVTDPAIEQMRSAVLDFCRARGGFDTLDQQAQSYLGVSGLMEREAFQRPFLLYRLTPGLNRFIGKRLAEFPAIAANTLPVTLAGIVSGDRLSNTANPLMKLAIRRFIRYARRHQNPSGDWGGVMEPTCWVVIALHYLGVGTAHPTMARALNRLSHWISEDDQGVEILPFRAEVWNTALGIRARMMQDEALSVEVLRGLEYLQREQGLIKELADWQNPRPGQPRFGGWAFQSGNPYGADPDSSSAVLTSMGMVRTLAEKERVRLPMLEISLQIAVPWLCGMQNPDGGWPSFTWGQKTKPPGPLYTKPLAEPKGLWQQMRLFLNPPLELADPALEDETGRILGALAHLGFDRDSREVQDAVAFLKTQIGENGVWWGRWEVNYLTSTGYILNGLGDIGIDPSSDWIKTATNWVLDKQNPDGGWGESAASYQDPQLAGIGESNPLVTAKVLTGLLSVHRNDLSAVLPSAHKAAEYLMAEQSKENWGQYFAVGVVLPPEALYTNPVFAQFVCLEALLNYRCWVQNTDEL